MACRKNKLILFLQFLTIFLCASLYAESKDGMEEFIRLDSVAPEIIVELKYAGNDNFTGAPVTGYENNPPCITTRAVAKALKSANKELMLSGFALKVLDAYRPKKAVNAFIVWAAKKEDFTTKNKYYPDLKKPVLLEQRYIASPSNHSRGSSVDVTLLQKNKDGTYTEMNMGSPFDFFGTLSHYETEEISKKQKILRLLLKDSMERHGFKSYSKEWWHFTLQEPTFPVQEFDFSMHEIEA